MRIDFFLEKIDKKLPKISYLCAFRMLQKVYTLEDEIDITVLKEFFIDYNNYEKLLNDYAHIIYKQYESSTEIIYKSLCEYFNEESDNKYLFSYRLNRIINQDPKIYLNFEDIEMRNAAISRVYDKISLIKNSKYYKKNPTLGAKELEELQKSLTLVKRALSII